MESEELILKIETAISGERPIYDIMYLCLTLCEVKDNASMAKLCEYVADLSDVEVPKALQFKHGVALVLCRYCVDSPYPTAELKIQMARILQIIYPDSKHINKLLGK